MLPLVTWQLPHQPEGLELHLQLLEVGQPRDPDAPPPSTPGVFKVLQSLRAVRQVNGTTPDRTTYLLPDLLPRVDLSAVPLVRIAMD